MIVDFPIPGSPEIRQRDPGTSPPPSTLFSSLIPVSILAVSDDRTCASRSGLPARILPSPAKACVPALPAPADAPDVLRRLSDASKSTTFCSNMEFQAPQTGHCPTHLALSLPHSLQTKTVFAFFAISFPFTKADLHRCAGLLCCFCKILISLPGMPCSRQ